MLSRIDLDALTSPAIREFNERGPDLIKAYAEAVERNRTHLKTMTRARILAALHADAAKLRPIPNAANLPKAELVEQAAQVYVETSYTGRELAEIRRHADADRAMAGEVNEAIARAEDEWDDLRGQGDIRDADYFLERSGWDFRVRTALARIYMSEIARAVTRGEDIHVVARKHLLRAIQDISSLPSALYPDTPDGGGHKRIITAQAAQAFVAAYARSYGALDEEAIYVGLAMEI